MTWVWVNKNVLLSLHREQLAEHGGADGIRDGGLLDSALARPENIAAYETPSVFQLAAAYSFGIVKNHPFIDGNKRTGFIACILFLELNGQKFGASEVDAVDKTQKVAAGEIDESAFAEWLQFNCKSQ